MPSIPGSRGTGSALERFTDRAHMRDDKVFYWGNDGDFGFEYDEDGNNVLLASGSAIRFVDSQEVQLGADGDFQMTFDGTRTTFAGADLRMSDTQLLQFGTSGVSFTSSVDASGVSDSVILTGLPTSDTGVSGALYINANSDLQITP